MKEQFQFLPDFLPGTVWLAGAGPGDPGLLTLLVLHGLKHADVVVYDALVDKRILELIPTGVEKIDAGKRGGRPSPKQPDITDRLIGLARQGNRVLRLKGGDPFVFGRGPEEAMALVEAKIPFRIVPGITAGVGGLAYAGIPATARETNAAVTFVTGHDQDGMAPALDWDALAKGSPVLVLYMALGTLDEIANKLMVGGRKPDEPVAIISRAATPQQKVLVSTLGQAAKDVANAGLEPPALVVVGQVVALRETLSWWDGGDAL
jgi:uroporphyrin-III C-methyltransferase